MTGRSVSSLLAGTTLVWVLLAAAAVAAAAPSAEPDPAATPRAEDVPQPVSGSGSLAGDALPDITRFLEVRTADAPSLSPDGERLAFSSDITGEPQVWVVDAAGGWPRQITFGEPVTFHAWSPAGDWIIYGTDRGGNEREGFYLVSPDGLEERELLAPSDAFRVFGAFTRDGEHIAYGTTARTGLEFDLHLLEVDSGRTREVLRGRMGLYPAAWRPDGGALLLNEARGEDANDVYLFDVAEERLETLFSPADRAYYGEFEWVPDGRGFYLASNQGRQYAGLAYYDLAAGALEWLETPESDVDEVALSGDGRYLMWTLNDGGYSEVRVRDLERGESLSPPPLSPGVVTVTWAARAPVAAIRVSGPQVPGDVWTWRPGSGGIERATHSSTAGLDMDAMVIPEHRSFRARDGLMLHGLLYLPEGGRDDEPPVLIDVHGGPTAQSRPSFEAVTQYLVSRGIAVFALNFRGSTGYGKDFARANDGELRTVEYLDMADAVAWLGDEGLVDSERAAVMGGSYGGYLSMAAVTRLPEVFDAGVSFVGVSNWLTALEGASPSLKASDRVEYGDIGDPDARAMLESLSPVRYVSGDEPPVMVIHGANDPRDPVTESDQFVQTIREAGGEVEYLRFPDEGHGIRKLSNRIIAYRRIADFLERNLRTETPR